MGGTQSTSNIQPTKYEEQINIITHVEENEEEIFSKISDLTKDILIKYSDMHLDENFCNNLAIIYQDKLNTFKIKLLRGIYDKISAKKIQYELLLVNKYADKNDDKFKVEDDLKVGIEELFFNQNIKFNPTYLSQIDLFDPNIKIEDIFKKIITNKKYIDQSINFSDLLNDKSRFQRNKKTNNNNNNRNNNQTNENISENNDESLRGGANTNYLLKQNNPAQLKINNRNTKQFPKYTNKEKENYKRLRKQQRDQQQGQNYRQQKQQQQGQRQNQQSQGQQQKEQNYFPGLEQQEQNYFPGLEQQNTGNISSNNNNNINNNINNNFNPLLNSKNLRISNYNKNKLGSNTYINSSKNIEPPKSSNNNLIEKLKKNLSNARREKNLLLQQQQQKQQQQRQNQQQQQQPKKVFNYPSEPVIKQERNIRNNKEQKQNLSQQKSTNIYSVPKNFKVKNPCSTKGDDCYLNKKQICELISQHFIVRNNIIAAILSCIPRKVGNNYEGGICYQQFINLNNCKVCIPENYKDLLNSNNKDKNKDKTLKFIQDIATASLNLTKEACKENNGTYYNLSKSQEIALVDKAKTNKMNSFFFICRKKIKDVYLENLKLLIEILNKLNESPVINNATLNIISNDTKVIIDKMYTLCQYYYIYAIISLLNADITTEDKTKKDFFKKDIKEFV